nr:class F sortase [Salsipaludibacter albus]
MPPVATVATIEDPGTPTGPVTPQFAPVSPAPPTETTPANTARPPEPDPAPSTPAPSPPPVPAGLPHAEPVRIAIPDLGITSELVRLGLNPDGSLQVPEDFDLAGWYADGPAPGDAEAPPAVIVGHVDSTTGPAVFHRLRELVVGQRVDVTREDGSVAVFRVRDTVQYPKAALPTDEVYATRSPSELVLITCSGAFDRAARSYLDNFVVTASLDPEASSVPP